MALLENIKKPSDMKSLKKEDLPKLCKEMRDKKEI